MYLCCVLFYFLFQKKCETDATTSSHKDKKIQSYMILPVQRTPRCKKNINIISLILFLFLFIFIDLLILRELIKSTPKTHKDYKP